MLRLKTIAANRMPDTAQIGTQSGGDFGSNPATYGWTYDSANPVNVFVDTSASAEVKDGSGVTITNAIITAPIGTAITSQQRWMMTHRYREALAAVEYYSVEGAPQEAKSGVVCACKRVEGGSIT